MSDKLITVPVAKVHPSPDNPRKHVGDVRELAASMKGQGILVPLLVVERPNDEYLLVAGSRRLQAAKDIGMTEVPVIVKTMADKQRLEIMLVENLHREDLTEIEEAETYAKLIDSVGYSQRQLAEKVGKSQSHISKRISLLGLPEDTKKLVDKGDLPVTDALELVKLKEPKDTKVVLEEAQRSPHASMERLVERANEARAILTRTEEVKAKAKADKATFIEREDVIYGTAKPRIVGKDAHFGGALTWVDAKAHAKEPCHAVTVDRDGSPLEVCTEPANHPTSPTRGDSRAKPDAPAKKEKELKLRAAKKAREEFIAATVTKRVPVQERNDAIFTATVTFCNSEPAKFACKMLGLAEGNKTDPKATLVGFASVSSENLAKAALAVALGYLESSFNSGWDQDTMATYLKTLRELGYKPSAAENSKANIKPRRSSRAA